VYALLGSERPVGSPFPASLHRMATSIEYDRTHWPLVVLELPADVSDLDVGGLARSLDVSFARERKFVSMMDASAVTHLPQARTRAALSAWAKRVEPLSERFVVANALVVPNGLARGVLTAIHWVAPPVTPTLVCSTVDEGLVFLREHARKAELDDAPIARFAASRRRGR